MIYVLLADGFEEAEMVVPVDILRRGGQQVMLVGVSGKCVRSGRGINVKTDISIDDIALFEMDMLILPGGQPGVENLWKNSQVRELVKYAASEGKYIAAICAAPIILGRLGLLDGKNAVCYPGYESELKGAQVPVNRGTADDGEITTARAASDAFEFGFLLLGKTSGDAAVLKVKDAICYGK